MPVKHGSINNSDAEQIVWHYASSVQLGSRSDAGKVERGGRRFLSPVTYMYSLVDSGATNGDRAYRERKWLGKLERGGVSETRNGGWGRICSWKMLSWSRRELIGLQLRLGHHCICVPSHCSPSPFLSFMAGAQFPGCGTPTTLTTEHAVRTRGQTHRSVSDPDQRFDRIRG